MEWYVVLALVLAIPLILFPVVLVWFLNIKGIRDTAQERRAQVRKLMKKWGRMGAVGTIAIAIYGFAIWFFLGRFGWPAALATALVLPIIFFVPVLIWASVASGLSQVVFDRMRRRSAASRRRAAGVVTEESR